MASEITEVCKVLRKNKHFVLTSHLSPDGDGIGCMYALRILLQSMGKQVDIVCQDPMPTRYRFLGGKWRLSHQVKSMRPDVMINIECPVLSRIGNALSVYQRAPVTMNIDHHPGNDRYATVNWVDIKAAATGEMIYRIFKKLKKPLTRDVARYLYISILTDTGSFRYGNTTPLTHRIASELIQYDVKPDFLVDHLYDSRTYPGIKLLTMALKTFQISADGQVAWFWVTQKMLRESGASTEDSEGFVNFARSVETAKVACFFREAGDGIIKVSLRSKRSIDVNRVAGLFGGGGHKAASGCQVKGRLPGVAKKLVTAIQKELKRKKR
jgi:bifunctional oligoribonuclease and PAP phosphatase NrnA